MSMFEFPVGAVVFHPLNVTYGHVKGFSINALGETVVIVLWETGEEYHVHPNLIKTQEETNQ